MKNRPLHFLSASRISLGALCLGLLSACAIPSTSPTAAVTSIPASLQPSANERAVFTWHAIGSQNYECRATDKGTWAWTLAGFDADLYNQKDEKVGTHGVGPHWAAVDGSRAQGTIKARAAGTRPADIVWLLLSAQSTGGPGKLASITSVQRINTEGGSAPASGCATATDQGKRSQEGYTSDYVFFAARG